ncbi:alpha/beta fold hydrolase [Streptomyces sp. NPDC055060]
MAFNSQQAIPEQLVDDRRDMREYVTAFSTHVAYGRTAFGGARARPPFTEAETDEYVRTYGRAGVRHAGFELYRSLDQNERDNAAARPSLSPMLRNVTRAVEIPKSGHWLAEENPAAVAGEILDFTAR